MPRLHLRSVIPCLCLALPVGAPAQDAPPRPTVLLVFPLAAVSPGSVDVELTLRTLLREHAAGVEVFSEYLDAARYEGLENEAALARSWVEKHRGHPPVVVVALGDPAFRFLAANREWLWRGVAMVHAGLGDLREEAERLWPGASGVLVDWPFGPTLELARRLAPGTRRVVLVTGLSPTDRQFATLARRALAGFPDLAVTELAGPALDDLPASLGRLPADAIVLYASLLLDSAGVSTDLTVAGEAVALASSRPVFSVHPALVGTGVVGGVVADYGGMAREAAAAVLARLGDRGSPGPPRAAPQADVVLDWRQLRRFDLETSAIPPHAVVRYRPPSLWRQNPWLVLGAVVLILAQALLIGGLLVLRRRRLRAQAALDRRLAFETLVARLSGGLLPGTAREAAARLPELLGEMAEFLGVDRAGILQWRDASSRPSRALGWLRPGADGGPTGGLELPFLHAAAREQRVIRLDRVPATPPGGDGDALGMEPVAARSFLAIPLVASGTGTALLGVGTLRAEREWTDEDLERLQVLARPFSGHVLREWAEEEARTFHALQSAVVDAVAGELAIVDADGLFWWLDADLRDRAAPDWLHQALPSGTAAVAALQAAAAAVPEAGRLGRAIAGALAGQGPAAPLECRHLRGGRDHWCEAHVRPLDRPEGGVVVALNDVTERKRLEAESQSRLQELAHVNRVASLGELTASLAHELNQPLTAILSNAQAARLLLDTGSRGEDEVRGALDDIVQDDRRAGEIILRIRRLLKKGPMEPAPVDLALVARDVVLLAAATAAKRRVALVSDLPAPLPAVPGDAIQLQQVLLNLVINAIDAAAQGSDGRQVTVSLRNGAGAVEVEVRDTGPGIPEEHLPRIFGSFFTTKPDGLGMGLSISRRIVESHGGRIWAESSPSGAVLRFTLPAGPPA